MLLLISPSKGETLPQHLPLAQRLVHAARHRRGVDLVRAVLGFGVLNHLDAQSLFEQWRDTEPDFPLFTRGGTHWSRIAAARVAVHLLDELERISGVDVVNLDLAPLVMGDGPGGAEDMVVLANLLAMKGCSDPMPLPNVVRRPGDQGEPHAMLLVSSSFAWALVTPLVDPAVTSRLAVYYYFKSVTEWVDGRQTEKRPIDFTPEELRAEILRYRFVVLECNFAMVPRLGFDFPAAVLKAFGPPRSVPSITPEQLESLKPLLVPGQR